MPTNEHPYVESNEGVLGGEPCIKGTRTPVRAIVEHWKFGHTLKDILDKLPYLQTIEIIDALDYYADHRETIEEYIALNQVPVDD